MAQFYDINEMKDKLERQLKIIKWDAINDGEYFQVELPVVLYFNYQRLLLNIYPKDDGYLVSDDGETFIEYSGDAEYYLNLFNQNDKNYHYEIELKDNRICKFYKYDYSLMSALDEFIRFFIYLDTYMRDNNIV